jgi:hypothetical protein
MRPAEAALKILFIEKALCEKLQPNKLNETKVPTRSHVAIIFLCLFEAVSCIRSKSFSCAFQALWLHHTVQGFKA